MSNITICSVPIAKLDKKTQPRWKNAGVMKNCYIWYYDRTMCENNEKQHFSDWGRRPRKTCLKNCLNKCSDSVIWKFSRLTECDPNHVSNDLKSLYYYKLHVHTCKLYIVECDSTDFNSQVIAWKILPILQCMHNQNT